MKIFVMDALQVKDCPVHRFSLFPSHAAKLGTFKKYQNSKIIICGRI
jgi:hypothetical protein